MQKIKLSSLRLELYLWLPVVLYAYLIYYFSSLSSLPSSDLPFFDKFEHTLEYAFFSFILMRAFAKCGLGLSRINAFAWAIIIAFIYGLSDELHQIFVPGRSADLFDILFDLFGAGIGAYVYSREKIILKI